MPGRLAKTDVIDARLLALMASMFADRLRRYVAPPLWQRELREWVRRRGQVVVLLQAQKQQAAMAAPAVRKLATRTIAALVRELAAIEKTMKDLINEHATPALRSSTPTPAASGTSRSRATWSRPGACSASSTACSTEARRPRTLAGWKAC